MDLGLSGKVAFVCASSRGIGKAAAKRLSREGAPVVICGFDRGALEDATGERSKAIRGFDKEPAISPVFLLLPPG